MQSNGAICLDNLDLRIPEDGRPAGVRVLQGLIDLAERSIRGIEATSSTPLAAISRLRGTGRGVSLSRILGTLDRDMPLELEYPFEGSQRVGGAVWLPPAYGIESGTSVAKLRWSVGATDLPMHVHDHSDRFIIVRSGRGYFHVTDEFPDDFTGTRVRSVPARERDVFMFTRGVVHTFSTEQEPMELLSCQLPYLPFDHPQQYRLPKERWTAGENRDGYRASIQCDTGWTVLATTAASSAGL